MKEVLQMHSTLPLRPLETHEESRWRYYLVESLLACAGALLPTAFIAQFHLYPGIPNISIVYLLVVLALASTRSHYTAILASILSFLAFDFFLVPPLYRFTIDRIEEWLALFVFLVAAVLTSQLASSLRQRAEEAGRRERETRILYELMRAVNSKEQLEQQLTIIAKAITGIFASWGVYECAFLLPEKDGSLSVQGQAPQLPEHQLLSSDERASALWALTKGESVLLRDTPSKTGIAPHLFVHQTATHQVDRRSLRFIPLQTGQQIVGVVCLRIQNDPRWFAEEEHLEDERIRPNARTTFFWTFIDQATLIIERAHLRRENLHIELLKRTDALRASLLSSVSHDLRTPLSSIKAAASSLLQEEIAWNDEERHSFAFTIEREADRLNRLVGNLLDMSRIEGGALVPEKELYPFDELMNDVLDRLSPLLHGRTITTDLPDDLPPVPLDYLQIDQVLTNLLENAVRYTPADKPIDISISAQSDQITVMIADRGPGIPAEDRERIFDKFYRVQSGRYHATGSGLGLAVCKGLIEAHDGHIWAESRPNGGSVFTITLPLTERTGLLV
jgi:two-component system, OmpR family, sensor histidine kinase KdpD